MKLVLTPTVNGTRLGVLTSSYKGKECGSVARNYIFSLIWRCYGPKRDILDYWGKIRFFNYPIISYRKIKVYRVETIDMGISHWNNGISGTISIVSTL